MNTSKLISAAVYTTLSLSIAACGAAPRHEAKAPSRADVPSAAPAPLQRSLFSHSSSGSLSENDLQKVLRSPMDVTFPMRVGVVSLNQAFQPSDKASIGFQSIVSSTLTERLKGDNRFSFVSDVSTELPNPKGIEGLRTIAARYRTRFLLLCHVRTEDRSHLNNWAWLYPTVIGMFVAPGMTVSSDGMLQASLLDVKSGTVLFTVNQPFSSSDVTWLIGASRQQRQSDGRALQDASVKLSSKVLSSTERLVDWVARERNDRAMAEAKRPMKPVANPVQTPENVIARQDPKVSN